MRYEFRWACTPRTELGVSCASAISLKDISQYICHQGRLSNAGRTEHKEIWELCWFSGAVEENMKQYWKQHSNDGGNDYGRKVRSKAFGEQGVVVVPRHSLSRSQSVVGNSLEGVLSLPDVDPRVI